MNRRDFINGLSGVSILMSLPACTHSLQNNNKSHALAFVSAAKVTGNHSEADNAKFVVIGLAGDKTMLWQTPLPQRAHASAISPNGQFIIVTGRRPSKQAWLLEAKTGKLIETIYCKKNRHFYGHSVFSKDGNYIYSTQNNTITATGVISIRALNNPQKVIKEFYSYGTGPHELHFLHDGKTLVVANGGIKTQAGTRKKLNLDTMQPNLAYIDARTGHLIQKVSPPHHHMSIRHIDVSEKGKVVIGVQYQGEKTHQVPLLFTHMLGSTSLKPIAMNKNASLSEWSIFNQYIGSVAVSSDAQTMIASSPRGNCAVVVDLQKNRVVRKIAIRDCSGVSYLNTSDNQSSLADPHNSFILSDGLGQTSELSHSVSSAKTKLIAMNTQKNIQWDNHIASI